MIKTPFPVAGEIHLSSMNTKRKNKKKGKKKGAFYFYMSLWCYLFE